MTVLIWCSIRGSLWKLGGREVELVTFCKFRVGDRGYIGNNGKENGDYYVGVI